MFMVVISVPGFQLGGRKDRIENQFWFPSLGREKKLEKVQQDK